LGAESLSLSAVTRKSTIKTFSSGLFSWESRGEEPHKNILGFKIKTKRNYPQKRKKKPLGHGVIITF